MADEYAERGRDNAAIYPFNTEIRHMKEGVLLSAKTPVSPRHRVAVVIPVYKRQLSDAEIYSLDTTCNALCLHDIFIIGPVAIKSSLQDYANDRARAGVQFKTYADSYFGSIEGYNELMRSHSFYRSFDDYEFILIAQTDALVFFDDLDKWCARKFSYIGAPWFVGLNKPTHPLTLMAVGNGGFSLRRVEDFIRVLSWPRHIPNVILGEHDNSLSVRAAQWIKHKWVKAYNFPPLFPDINEDFFWGLLVPRAISFFTVPTPEEASAFAFEREPRFLYELNGSQLPFGCHGWEKYDPEFWRSKISALPRN